MNNLQDQGRACYKRGDYKKAIELFDRAIGRSPSVQLLDNRAACHQKLNDYSTALKDAKKAIQLHREDAIGYLRAGRLLVKMEKQTVALEIYTHGLKCIKHVGQGYEQLRKVHKELMDLLCPPKSVDPMTVLPRELAEAVLEYLSFRQRMNACLVSKQWSHFIRSVPSLWQHLDLSGARRKVRTAFVSRVINVARARLKAATLNNLYDFDKTLSALAKHCPIEELTMLECGLQSNNLTHILARATRLRSLRITQGSQINSYELAPLLATLTNTLETFECWIVGRQAPGTHLPPCHRLKYFSMTFADAFDHFRLIIDIPKSFPALETLIVHQKDHSTPDNPLIDLQDCEHLRHLDLQMVLPSPERLRVPEGLIVFNLDCQHPSGMPTCYLPLLDELEVHGSMAMYKLDNFLSPSETADSNDSEEKEGSPRASNLSRLSISFADSTYLDLERLVLHPRLKNLTSLAFKRCLGIDDGKTELVASTKFGKLRCIDLTGAALTGIGVKHLVSSLNLETLILNECLNVSPDAVEWARSKGVRVKYRISSGSEGGRKVRY